MVTSVRIAVLAGLAAVAFSQPAAAHSVKPGLWEMTINSKMAGGGLPAGMMPNTMKMKVCIQPEESKADLKDMLKAMQPGEAGDCTISDLKESGGSYSFTTQCKSGMSGKMSGRIAPTEMQQSGDMELAAGGRNMKVNFNNTGKWLADTCPPGTPGAK